MKKLFLFVALATMTLCVSAQEMKKFRFGPSVGLNVATMNLEQDHSSKIGFNIGAIAEYNFTDNFFLASGLKYSMKGVTWEKVMPNGADLKANPGYLEIPIHGGARYCINDKFNIFAEFGPYFAVGVSGKYKADGYSEYVEGFYDEAQGDLQGKRFDFGLGFVVGAEYSNIQLRIGYDLGLIGVFDVSNSAKNRNLFINVGYMF